MAIGWGYCSRCYHDVDPNTGETACGRFVAIVRREDDPRPVPEQLRPCALCSETLRKSKMIVATAHAPDYEYVALERRGD